MKRALILCPGRGSYNRESLGSLKGVHSASLHVFDTMRTTLGRPSVSEMDASDKFSSKLHIRGENASALTAGCTLADLDQVDPKAFELVGVVGNSMGWYTALGYAGALSLTDCAHLIETLGQYQAENIIGGQIVYPIVNDDWTICTDTLALVEQLVADTPDLYWSIRLGGQAILGGTETALNAATASLPPQQRGAHTFPIRLPLHSAFHTPLMHHTAQSARDELGNLDWMTPEIPLIDGVGRVFRPHSSQPQQIRDYTLGAQITDTFDLGCAIQTALKTLAPDVVILPGPGSNLGSAVAQSMIACGWAGLKDRADFIARQKSRPILLSMVRPDQRKLVVAT